MSVRVQWVCLSLNMIVKKERHRRIMTAALQTHHKLTRHKPTQQKNKNKKLKDDKARSSQHGDVDASRHESTGSAKKVMDDGKKKTRNMTDDSGKRQINFNRGMHVQCKQQQKTTTKYIYI